MFTSRHARVVAVLLVLSAGALFGDYKDDIGFTLLQSELGAMALVALGAFGLMLWRVRVSR